MYEASRRNNAKKNLCVYIQDRLSKAKGHKSIADSHAEVKSLVIASNDDN